MAINETIVKGLILRGTLSEDTPVGEPSDVAIEAAEMGLKMMRENPEWFAHREIGIAKAVSLNLAADPEDKHRTAIHLLEKFFSVPENEDKIRPATTLKYTPEMLRKLSLREKAYLLHSDKGRG